MKLCFPAENGDGLASPVCAHFGGAPGFLIVDTDTRECTPIVGVDVHAGQHGGCQPLRALAGHEVDAIVVGGIGAGAMMKLAAAGVRVFQARPGTISENLDLYTAGQLLEVDVRGTCAGHGDGGHGGCAH